MLDNWMQLFMENAKGKDADFKIQRLRKDKGKTIYPPQPLIFRALELTPPEKVKVVILGQDPYHGMDQANGLAFSVNLGQKIPPSLNNIYKELNNDLDVQKPLHGDLTSWATQGVLLLNTVLTVEAGEPGSHYGLGWESFTKEILQYCMGRDAIFLLWGNKARQTFMEAANDFTGEMNLNFMTAPHPSPLSASKGFFGCKHFSKTNQLLREAGKEPIDWRL